jgi:hypothetical protein
MQQLGGELDPLAAANGLLFDGGAPLMDMDGMGWMMGGMGLFGLLLLILLVLGIAALVKYLSSRRK